MYFNFILKIRNEFQLKSVILFHVEVPKNACTFGTFDIISIYLQTLTDIICIYQ